MSDEEVTMHECPVVGCNGGMIVTRIADGEGFIARSERCGFCEGTGAVTPERFATYGGPRKNELS